MNQNGRNWVYHAPGDILRLEAFLSDTAFSPHRHDTYAIGMTMQGVQSFDYRGSTRHSLPGGVVVLHPDEMHDGRPGTEDGFRYRTLYLSPALVQSVLGGKALPYIEHGVSTDTRLVQALLPLMQDYDRALDKAEYEDALFNLVEAMHDIASTKHERSPRNFKAAERAREYIHDCLDEKITLDALGAAARRDKWELSRDFKAFFGTSPFRYVLMRRLEKAMALIRAGAPVAAAASESGFADQSHFNRHFRKTYGMTPGAWFSSNRS